MQARSITSWLRKALSFPWYEGCLRGSRIKEMAVDAVWSEPLSHRYSLQTGKSQNLRRLYMLNAPISHRIRFTYWRQRSRGSETKQAIIDIIRAAGASSIKHRSCDPRLHHQITHQPVAGAPILRALFARRMGWKNRFPRISGHPTRGVKYRDVFAFLLQWGGITSIRCRATAETAPVPWV